VMSSLDERLLEKARSIIREIIRKLYGEGFLTVMVFHIRKILGSSNVSLIRLLIEDPKKIYEAMKNLYGGEDTLDSFLTVTLLAINEMIGYVMSPQEVIEAFKTGNREIITKYIRFLIWRYERSKGGLA